MTPAPVRTPNKRNVAALPETNRLSFLLAASQLFAQSLPEVSSQLGSQALKWADLKQLALPRGLAGHLCCRCGSHCKSDAAYLVRVSRTPRRRQKQTQQGLQNKVTEHRIIAVCPCQVCGGSLAHSFVNEDAAHKMFPKSKLAPSPQTSPNVSSQKANKLPVNTATVQSQPTMSQHSETLLKPQQTAGQLQRTAKVALQKQLSITQDLRLLLYHQTSVCCKTQQMVVLSRSLIH
ncbi:hypothetical protein WJX82_001563 [Trebouxia sp. C0006]